jgi:hypothetical protein
MQFLQLPVSQPLIRRIGIRGSITADLRESLLTVSPSPASTEPTLR